MRYLGADTLDAARDAIAMCGSVAKVAAQLRVNESDLRRWLGLPEHTTELRNPRTLVWDLPQSSSADQGCTG